MYTTDPFIPPIHHETDFSLLHQPLAYSVPLYIQIADRLVSQIESGELSPGDRLPSERELSEKLGVNRMTLRRALRVLESQGLVLRKHGIGTFVGEPKIDRQMDVVFRFTRRMQNRGYTPGTEIISVDETEVDGALSRQLAVPVASPAYKILRLRSINHEPVMIESYVIPVRRFPGLDHYDLENRSIYEVMETEYGVQIARAEQSFEPVVASSFEAELLKIRVGAALMLEKRISYDQDNRPVEYGKDRYRGDRFRFVTEAAPFDL
jgi:DNA-binding GntR family transcriptional regulator